MGRVLQCLVCIAAMSSLLIQGVYNQNPPQYTNLENSFDGLHTRHLRYNQPNTENLYTRTSEYRKYRSERIQEQPRIEAGTNYPHKYKRGSLEQYGSELSDKVIFPGPTSSSTKKQEDPKITASCKSRGYCVANEVRNFPSKEVEQLIEGLDEEEKSHLQMDRLDDEVQIAQRLGGGVDNAQEIPLCDVITEIIHPLSLPDKEDKWWFVVNQDQKPVQGFLTERCRSEGDKCNELVMEIKNGYNATCAQKHVYRMVEAYVDGKKVPKQLRLPGCCYCKVVATSMG